MTQPQLKPTVKGDTLVGGTFACATCWKPSEQRGSGWRRVCGQRMHVCAKCKARSDKRRAA